MEDNYKSANASDYLSSLSFTARIRRRHILAVVFVGASIITPPALHAQAVGYTSGQFAVDPTGAATYSIAIQVPPGVRGLQPELALLYHSRAGNGQLGAGWSLAGLSAITHCPRTRAQDGASGGVNFDADDRFCLDGQRLMLIGGGQYGVAGSYRTEIESFQDIKAEGSAGSGPLDFVVRDKSSLRREYGTSADTRPLARNGAARLWLLRKISDRFGNYIQYSYNNTAGEPTLAEISYGNKRGAVLARILFSYEGRADRISRYVAGEEFPANQRLAQVSIFAAGSKVKSYTLGYAQGSASGRSQLVSVTECDAAGSCLRPLNFTWQQGSPGYSANTDTSPLPPTMSYLQIGDFDNDGISDYLYVNNGAWYVRPGKNPAAAIDTGLRVQNGDRPEYSLIADMNGDGCTDLVSARDGSGWIVWYSNCDSTFRASQQGYRQSYGSQDKYPLLVDLNGDGYPELVFKYTWPAGSTVLAYYANSPSGFASDFTPTALAGSYGQKLTPINFFGNGTPDLYVAAADDCGSNGPVGGGGDGGGGGGGGLPKKPQALTVSGTGNTSSCLQSQGVLTWNGSALVHADVASTDMVYSKNPLFLDLNGDGLTDILAPQCVSSAYCKWQAYVNRGGAWSSQSVTVVPTNAQVSEEATMYARAVDYNGNGLSDVVYPDISGRWSVMLSDGKTLGARQDTGLPAVGYPYTLFLDYNGNGLTDMLYLDGGWKIRWRGTGIMPDLMQQVTQGAGSGAPAQHTITYLPLSDLNWRSVLYSGSQGATAPPATRHFLGPLYVVRSFASHAGYNPGGTAIYVASYYRYAGAKLDQQGRGFLGFAVVEAANTNTNIVTRTRYRQDFPFTGMVSQAVQYVTTLTPTAITSTETQGRRSCKLPNGELDICPAPPPQAANSILDNPPGRLVTQTDNSFLANVTPVGTPGESRFPYVQSSTVRDYDLGSGNLYRKTATVYTYDTHGNAANVTVRSYNAAGADVSDVLIYRQFADDNVANWCFGLANDTQITRIFGISRLTMHSTATHDSSLCIRTSETSEPELSALTLISEYSFDKFGNREATTVKGPTVAARIQRTEFDGNGQFPVRLINPLGHVETQTWDPAFGNRLTSTDPNGVTTRWEYDGFGRRASEVFRNNDALRSTWNYTWCSGCRRPDAAYRLATTSPDGGRAVTEYDGLGRAVFNSRLGPVIEGSARVIDEETYYDPLGRAYLASRPYFDGAAARCWDYRQYDNLNRLTGQRLPATGSECSLGIPTLSSPPAYSRTTQYAYNGLQTTIIDPLGRRSVRTDNYLGKPASVTDADNHTTTYDYDALGNVARVTDANGNGDWTSLGLHKRHPEFPVVIRESCYTSRKTTWFPRDRKSTRLNSSHHSISYAVFCLKKKKKKKKKKEKKKKKIRKKKKKNKIKEQ